MNTGVYIILNVVNGKRYIGSAVRLNTRLNHHKAALRRGEHPNRHLQAAWNKYGEAAFDFRKLLICKPEHLVIYEQLCLDGVKPEYNILPTAGSALGYRHTEGALEDFRSRRHVPETKAKIAAANKRRSAELRAKLSTYMKARWAGISPEERTRRARYARAARA